MPTRYGSSPMVSSTRPQRGSRTTSSTGREALVHADRAQVVADAPRHLARPARGRRSAPHDERDRVGGRAPGGEAGEALLVGERRDAEPARRGDPLLRAQRARRRPRAGSTGAVPNGRVSWPRPVGSSASRSTSSFEVVLVRGDVAALVGCPDPDAVRAARASPRASCAATSDSTRSSTSGRRRATGHPSRHRIGRRCVVGGDRFGGHRFAGHPLTAPVRPPTMRRSKMLKKTSAGIIASEVNASTLRGVRRSTARRTPARRAAG